MKVCIAITPTEHNAEIYPDFFNARAYCICNSFTGSKIFYSRADILQSFAMGANKPFDTILTAGVKPMAYNILRTQNIPVYIPNGTSIDENLRMLLQNKLKPLQKEDVLPPSSCESDACNTCSTSCN